MCATHNGRAVGVDPGTFSGGENLIGDKAYDSDQLDEQLRAQGTEMISPHRSTRKRKTQDGRRLRRYERSLDRRTLLLLDSVATSAPGSLGVLPAKLSRLRAACSSMHPAQAILR